MIQEIFPGDFPNLGVSKGSTKVFGKEFSLAELKDVKDVMFRSLEGIEEVYLGFFLVDVKASLSKEGVEIALDGFCFLHRGIPH